MFFNATRKKDEMTEKEKKFDENEAAEQLNRFAGDVKSDEDVAKIVRDEDKIKQFFERIELLKKYYDDACDIFSLLKDRLSGVYSETPWQTIAALAGAILYVLSPIDLIIDIIPVIGYLDDAFVFGLAIKLANSDLEKYRAWKKARR